MKGRALLPALIGLVGGWSAGLPAGPPRTPVLGSHNPDGRCDCAEPDINRRRICRRCHRRA